MKYSLAAAIALATASVGSAAYAQDEPESDIKVSGSVALASEYRLRGISQTDSDPAIQGGVTIGHSSGFYVGTWASNLAGNGTFGGSNIEVDAIVGFSTSSGPVTFDIGGIYYIYPGTKTHDFFEVYASVSGALGPVNAKLGANWTPSQDNIGLGGGNNIWVYTDWAFPIEGTPITLKAHAGYSSGDSLYTKGGAAFDPLDRGRNKDVFDYSVGIDVSFQALTLNVSYVGTDLDRGYANANFGAGTKSGRDITKGTIVGTLSAAF